MINNGVRDVVGYSAQRISNNLGSLAIALTIGCAIITDINKTRKSLPGLVFCFLWNCKQSKGALTAAVCNNQTAKK